MDAAAREETERWWAALEADVSGRDLEVESRTVYHRGAFLARMSAHRRSGDRAEAARWWGKAVEVWSRLETVPSRYPPSVRSAQGKAMQKHVELVLRATDDVQGTTAFLSLYGLHAAHITAFHSLTSLLSSINHFTSAACALLQCGIAHLSAADAAHAVACTAQAEELRLKKGVDPSSAHSVARYGVLHRQLTLMLYPSFPLPAPPSPVAPQSSAAGAVLRCESLSVEALMRWRAGDGDAALSAKREEYEGWRSLTSRMLRSAEKVQPHTSAATPRRVRRSHQGEESVGGGQRTERVRRAEEREAVEEGTESGDGGSLVASLSSLSSPHTYVVLSSFLSCLRHYSVLLERCGQTRDGVQYLTLAASLSEQLQEERERPWLDLLRRRITAKRTLASEVQEASGTSTDAGLQDESSQQREAVMGDGVIVSDRVTVLCSVVERADLLRRQRQQHDAALGHYQEALSLLASIAQSPSPLAVSADRAPDANAEEKNVRRTACRRPTKSRAKKAAPERSPRVDDAAHPLLVCRAHIEAKIASLSFAGLAPAFPSSSSSLADAFSQWASTAGAHREHMDSAWALYFQARAQRHGRYPSAEWSASLLQAEPSTASLSPSVESSATLLRSALDSCFRLAPPYLTRVLLLSLCSAVALTSPLEAVFALNASVGLTARHSVNRAIHKRLKRADPTDSALSSSLSHLSLVEDSAVPLPGAAGEAERGPRWEAVRPLFSFEGGMEEERVKFEDGFLQRLPEEWTVVTMALSEDEDALLLSRIRASGHGAHPILLRLPLVSAAASPSPASIASSHIRASSKTRTTSRMPPTPPVGEAVGVTPGLFSEVSDELTSILHGSGAMNDAVVGQADSSTEVKERWWEGRFALDKRMNALLLRMENAWFGPWKSAIAGLRRDDGQRQQLHRAAEAITAMLCSGGAADAVGSFDVCGPPLFSYVHALMDCAASLSDAQLDAALVYLLGWTHSMRSTEEEVSDIVRSLPSTQRQLLQRVRTAVREQQLSGAGERLPVVLLLSSQLGRFPFESMPILSSHPVMRMPSYHFLLQHLAPYAAPLTAGRAPALSLSSHSFILNPSSDLPRTEATFAAVLPALHLTRGTASVQPTTAAFLAALSSDLFLYLGHGSGDQYIPSSLVEQRSAPRVALLMGCGSGRSKGVSREYDGWGMATSLLIAGAQSVVGNLWDVTDGEIDRFAIRVLERITGRTASHPPQGPSSNSRGAKTAKGKSRSTKSSDAPMTANSSAGGDVRSVAEVVAECRSACRLRYLMGASPVVYGIPVGFNREA